MEEKIDLEKSVLQQTMPMATQTSPKVGGSSQGTPTPQGSAEKKGDFSPSGDSENEEGETG